MTAKTVIMTEDRKMLAYSIIEEGIVNEKAAIVSLKQALESAAMAREQISGVVATGYGRDLVSFATRRVTEISCHARGANFLLPEVRTIIDIGGQDSKVMSVDEEGRVTTFQMNDKCAAGTGRFLQVMSRALRLSLKRMEELADTSEKPALISSVCTVFSESEIISLRAKGVPTKDIVAGLYESIGRRVIGLLSLIRVEPTVLMSGGVAKNKHIVRVLSRMAGVEISVPPEPQIVGAIGAALFALDGLANGGFRPVAGRKLPQQSAS